MRPVSLGMRVRVGIARAAAFFEKRFGLAQDTGHIGVFFADGRNGVRVEEPCKAGVFARFDADFRTSRFGEKENDGVIDALATNLEMKPFVRAEVRQDVEVVFLDSRFLLEFAERRVNASFSWLEVAFWKIPICATFIEQKIFDSVHCPPEDHEACYHLFLGRKGF